MIFKRKTFLFSSSSRVCSNLVRRSEKREERERWKRERERQRGRREKEKIVTKGGNKMRGDESGGKCVE